MSFIGVLYRRAVALGVATVLVVVAAACMLSGCGRRVVRFEAVPVADGLDYHVVVVGGEPEGVAAALAAARNGMKTLLVERGDALGGLMTLGMLNIIDMNHGPKNELLTRGIFEEFYDALGNAFDIDDAKAWFMKKCNNEPCLTVMLNTEVLGPVVVGNAVVGVELAEGGGSEAKVIRSHAVIDATVDGDVAAAAGAPFTIGAEDHGAFGRTQGVTLVFEVAGVDWKAVRSFLRNDGNEGTGAEKERAWGYAEQARDYVPTDPDTRFRGPNIARQKNGNVLLNALVIFGVDALDPDSYNDGLARGLSEIPYIIDFMRGSFVGFEDAEFVGHAPRLYVRETRHFVGEYRLTITDVLENRDFWDRVAHASYPVDLQSSAQGDFGNIVGKPDIYSIPFRCLVPLEVDQLLIASRCASYNSLPHGSARVIPVGMAAGEACGVAVAYSVEHGLSFREMAFDSEAVLWLQKRLVGQGAYLVEYNPPRMEVMDHWAYPGVVVMRELAMAVGGYYNDYGLEKEIVSRWTLQDRANRLMKLLSDRSAGGSGLQIPAWEFSVATDVITVGFLLQVAAQCVSLGDGSWVAPGSVGQGDVVEPMVFDSAGVARDYLVGAGVIGADVIEHFSDLDSIATYGQLFYVLGAVYSALMEG